jgi:prepilin-type N-terminal cleavage/methylation domain-containing protein
MTKRRQRTGFTLIELLVVMAIISILASMLFPSFAKARAKAEQTDCLSNLKQLGYAIFMYSSDYDGLAPVQDTSNWTASFQQFGYIVPEYSTTGTINWAQAVYPYTKNYQINECKSTIDWAPGSDQSQPALSYVMNGCFCGRLIDSCERPAQMVMLYDWTFDFSWAAINPAPNPNGAGYQFYYGNGGSPHEGMFDILYADSHVKSLPEAAFGLDIWYAPPNNMFYF